MAAGMASEQIRKDFRWHLPLSLSEGRKNNVPHSCNYEEMTSAVMLP